MSDIEKKVEKYYSGKIAEFGVSPKGVDWKDESGQITRFQQLVKVCPPGDFFTINDLGSGYGAQYAFMQQEKFHFDYIGYDLSEKMLEEARKLHGQNSNFHTILGSDLQESDYSVASGIFNVKMDTPAEEWKKYYLNTLESMNRASKKGFAFNSLTSYSDPEYMREDLYYADPLVIFDYCKRNFSRNVALLHDYDLYEFTILVRKVL